MFIRQSVETIVVSLTLCFAITILASVTAHCAEQQAELAPSELACEFRRHFCVGFETHVEARIVTP